MGFGRLFVALLALWLVWLPTMATACPACAGREGYGLGGILIMGAMIGLPFVMIGFLLPTIRRLNLERFETVSVPEERCEEV